MIRKEVVRLNVHCHGFHKTTTVGSLKKVVVCATCIYKTFDYFIIILLCCCINRDKCDSVLSTVKNHILLYIHFSGSNYQAKLTGTVYDRHKQPGVC